MSPRSFQFRRNFGEQKNRGDLGKFCCRASNKKFRADQAEYHFWSSQTGAEIDLLIVRGKKKFAFEIKYSSKPEITKSMMSAIESLGLKKILVIVPGSAHYLLSKQIEVFGIEKLISAKNLQNLFT